MLLLITTIALGTTIHSHQGFDWAIHIGQENRQTQRLVLAKDQKSMNFRVGRHRCTIKPSKQVRNQLFAQQQANISCKLAKGGSIELTTNTCRVLDIKDDGPKDEMTIAREMAFNIYRKLGDEASFKLKSKGKKYDVRVNCEPRQAGQYTAFRQQVAGPQQVNKSRYKQILENKFNENLLNKNTEIKHKQGSTKAVFKQGKQL